MAENNLDRAIQAGRFREIDGVVYDTRKPQSGWVSFANVKVLQITDEGAIVDTTPNAYSTVGIFVKNISARTGDTDFITFTAKQPARIATSTSLVMIARSAPMIWAGRAGVMKFRRPFCLVKKRLPCSRNPARRKQMSLPRCRMATKFMLPAWIFYFR